MRSWSELLGGRALELPPALRGVSCAIPAKAKVGVVGRTGSGKSTFLSHDDAGRFFALAVALDNPPPGSTAVVHLSSKPPPGQQSRVDPEPARLLCGYVGADEFPAGLPYPVLDPVRQRPSPG